MSALSMASRVAPLDGFPSPVLAEPVEIEVVRDHAFKKRKPDPVTGKRRIGCDVCGRGRNAREHMGAPPSMNSGNHSMQPMAYQALKHAWQDLFAELLDASGLPRGLESVSVEGLVGFPTLAVRDGGNFRWMIEKALGDALVSGSAKVAGGWIEDDCFFPVCRYEFGGLQAQHSPGRSWLRLMVFPRAPQSGQPS